MSRARSWLVSVITSPLAGRLSRAAHESLRRLARRPHTVIFFHRVADAWSWLLGQELERLLAEYEIALRIRVIRALPIDCVRDPERVDSYAAYDAMRLARAWGLYFPDGADTPSPSLTHLAERVILGKPDSLGHLLAATTAAWQGDTARLAEMAGAIELPDEDAAELLLTKHARELKRRGHYLGGMLWFQGEWFWGLDRLSLLEKRLRERGLNRGEHTLGERHFRPLDRNAAGSALPLDLEYFFSFRSPYSYLGALKVTALADRLGLNLVLRPVLPMVARGVPAPSRKLRYIVKDAARLARQDNIPFGPIRDPLGKGVERCLAVFHRADSKGLGREFMLAAMRAIWCEAADLTGDRALRRVSVAGGLSADDMRAALESSDWRARLEANAASLAVLGLWGVPGLCLRGPDDQPVAAAWGQDRMWVIERAARGVDVAMPPPRLVQ